MTKAIDHPSVIQAAATLTASAKAKKPCAPIATDISPLGLDGAYAVQERLTRTALADGRRLVGRKIGLTAAAVQKQLGVDQPDYGMLFADMEYGDGAETPIDTLLQPRVEAEIAFVLQRNLDGEKLTPNDVVMSIGYVLPAIEIVDSRIADWKISLLDTVADNASSGAYVLGSTPRRLSEIDLRLCGMVLEHRNEPVSTGCGAACLGNPLNAVLWLARKMVEVGRPLQAGDVVLSGALGPMVPAVSGGVYRAHISGLGSVAAAFTASGK